MRIDIPVYQNKNDLFEFLLENKSMHIMEKKADSMKKADAIQCVVIGGGNANKLAVDMSTGKIEVNSVINTTNVMDSHQDVHIKGIWNKSLKQNNKPILLQEHIMDFEHLISDEVKASAVNTTWRELGFKFEGETQALMFKSIVEQEVNDFMFAKYGKGQVKNHSVGMRYINITLGVNNDSSEFKEEFDVYNKYIDDIINRKDVEEQGFFWAVKEAKVIEGSAVVKGSNPLTPTSSMEAKSEQSDDTHENEQSLDTPNDNVKNILLYN